MFGSFPSSILDARPQVPDAVKRGRTWPINSRERYTCVANTNTRPLAYVDQTPPCPQLLIACQVLHLLGILDFCQIACRSFTDRSSGLGQIPRAWVSPLLDQMSSEFICVQRHCVLNADINASISNVQDDRLANTFHHSCTRSIPSLPFRKCRLR